MQAENKIKLNVKPLMRSLLNKLFRSLIRASVNHGGKLLKFETNAPVKFSANVDR